MRIGLLVGFACRCMLTSSLSDKWESDLPLERLRNPGTPGNQVALGKSHLQCVDVLKIRSGHASAASAPVSDARFLAEKDADIPGTKEVAFLHRRMAAYSSRPSLLSDRSSSRFLGFCFHGASDRVRKYDSVISPLCVAPIRPDRQSLRYRTTTNHKMDAYTGRRPVTFMN